MPRKFKEKECETCKASYAPNSGRQRYCKECGKKNRKERNKRRYQANPEKEKERVRRWHQANPEKVKERVRRWQQANPEKVNEKSRRWYQEKKKQDIACLYSITNKATGKRYIGESLFVENRWGKHRSSLKAGRHKNSLLQKDYNKHGPEAFEFAIIKEINKENFQTEKQLKEHLRMEEAKMILKEVDEGKELYNVSLNPEYVVQVLRERLKQSSIGSIGNA